MKLHELTAAGAVVEMAHGSPVFCALWSLSGVPALSLPLLAGASGMPLGLQLLGSRGSYSRLLQAAHWLEEMHLSIIA